MERLLTDYHIVSRVLIPRMREGKIITGNFISSDFSNADYDVFNHRDAEVVSPMEKQIPKTGLKSIPYRVLGKMQFVKDYLKDSLRNLIFNKEDEILYGDLELLEDNNRVDNREIDYQTICKHIQIYNVSLTREKTLWRHFIRCPNGSLCEIFDKMSNQESSSIADIHSNDYWIRKARIDSNKREKRREMRARYGMQAPQSSADFGQLGGAM